MMKGIKMKNMLILAQANEERPSGVTSKPVTEEGETKTVVPDSKEGQPTDADRKPGFDTGSLIFIILIFVVMYFLLFRGPRKRQQQQRQMVQSLRKNDRVRTIGGIMGTIVDIKGDEITLKIDESTNTKIKVISSAIGKNLSQD
jgi:preprotein translocase subunit YajC